VMRRWSLRFNDLTSLSDAMDVAGPSAWAA
jgi:hypothetical protein